MIIYKATNSINNKFYIGMTRQKLQARIHNHYGYSKNQTNIYFYNAIKKYGFENFKWEIIDSSAKTVEELKQLEIYYISKLKPHYNMTSGGDGGHIFSEEVRKRMSISQRNRPPRPPMSEEQKEKLRQANLGKKASLESRKKMSEKAKGRVKTKQHRENLSKSLKGKKKCRKKS